MRLRWLLHDFVPPELGLTRSERDEVYRLAQGMSRWDWRSYLRFLRMYFLILAMPFAALMLVVWTIVPRGTGVLIAVLLFLVTAYIVAAYSLGKTQWSYTWSALRALGHDVCRNCRYDLRGLDERVERCPECGWLREKVPGHESA